MFGKKPEKRTESGALSLEYLEDKVRAKAEAAQALETAKQELIAEGFSAEVLDKFITQQRRDRGGITANQLKEAVSDFKASEMKKHKPAPVRKRRRP